jgi:tRNA U34 5-methylaminomethyl-2-thiouridine-forming methyltransferase MnmC
MSDASEKIALVPTADGTVTLRDKLSGEFYHNIGGAFLESMETYALPSRLEDILQRRKNQSQSKIKLLDACFGLGYNTFVLWHHIINTSHLPIDQVDVVGVEYDFELLKTLPDVLEQECFSVLLEELKDANGQTLVDNLRAFIKLGIPTKSLALSYQTRQGPKFNLNLVFDDLRVHAPLLATNEAGTFDLIFHDPFSPSKLPHLWTAELFDCYFKILREDSGRLLTYCAATAVRGGLQKSGFNVYRTRDVALKQGGTLAVRSDEDALFEDLIFHLRPEEVERLGTSSAIPYRDPGFTSDRKEVLRRREKELNEYKAKLKSGA